MSEYKTAKEAFVADNPGASILSINAISLAALTSYLLYAVTSRRFRPHPLLDYATSVLPLLLAVTIASNRPISFNFAIAAVAGVLQWMVPDFLPTSQQNARESVSKNQPRGKWLDDSDSDEEPAFLAASQQSANGASVKLPSELVPTASTTALSPSPSLISPSPALSPGEFPSSGSRRRRHSPTPSTYNHTSINVLPTPELLGVSSLTSDIKRYPSPTERGTAKSAERLPFLSVYRAHMMIMTIHCILAVDFPVFPRWQGKCETYGTSLMDVGVGSFVFSLGIVSVAAFAKQVSSKPLDVLLAAFNALKKAGPVLALGVVRVIMVKGSEYPEHVSEYGVHWNFFFTLGLLPVFGTLLRPWQRSYMRWTYMGLLSTAIHQIELSSTNLQTWTLSAARTGIVSRNKEGLVSLPGYLAIYLFGLGTGERILRPGKRTDQGATIRGSERKTGLALELFSYSVAWWTMLLMLRLLGAGVSRRLANLPYVLWVTAYNTTFIFAYLLIELLLAPSTPTPPLLNAINANGLVIFLIANLLTGLINLSIKTMYVGDVTSMAILVGYSGAVCCLSWLARQSRLKL